MKNIGRRLALASFLLLAAALGYAEAKHSEAVAQAMQTLDAFMLAFNNRDMQAWAKTLNYPHVRFASGGVTVWEDGPNFGERAPFAALAQTGWDHSHWVQRNVVLASPRKVHLATVFQRFNTNNEVIGTYESLYIVTKVNDRWGIQARSSLAP